MAEDLVINPNTSSGLPGPRKRGIVELRHGSGVFVRESAPAAPA